jgi:ubiquinone/menaquinone biosynthesis C-methylase UbiE
MDEYTLKTMHWLDDRFRETDQSGVYFAHQPIYGFRIGHCEPQMSERYLRTYRILKKLACYKVNSILDVGGAEGYKAFLIKKFLHIQKVESCDLSAEAAKRAEEIFKIKSCQADMHKLPFEDKQFEAVICSEALEHVFDRDTSLKELLRIAKNLVIITVPNEKPLKGQNEDHHAHINFFNADSLNHLTREGWEVHHEKIMGSWLRPIRAMVNAEKKEPSGKPLLKKILFYLFNMFTPLFRIVFNRRMTALAFELDELLSSFSSHYDAHIYCLIRKDNTPERTFPTKIPMLGILNFMVPLYFLKKF